MDNPETQIGNTSPEGIGDKLLEVVRHDIAIEEAEGQIGATQVAFQNGDITDHQRNINNEYASFMAAMKKKKRENAVDSINGVQRPQSRLRRFAQGIFRSHIK